MLKCEEDPKCLKNQPTPVNHKTSGGYSLATIDDNAQTLTLYNRQTEKVPHLPSLSSSPLLLQNVVFEVWDCHWSPRLFQVQGQLAWSIPPLATSSLLFALASKVDPTAASASAPDYTSFHGKIAVVRRGGIPLVFKILNLQVSLLPPSSSLSGLSSPSLRKTAPLPALCWTLRTARNSIKLVSQDHKK
jgi:hypothetical protein